MIADGIEEQIDTEQPEIAEAAEPKEPVAGEEDTSTAETAVETVEGDNRLIPKYLKDMQANDPAGYQKAKAAFFQHRDFMAAFPEGPNAAKTILKTMADIGGSDGLTALQQRATQMDSLTELARTNPAAVLDEIAQVAPDRMEDVATKAVGMWYQSNPESYDRAMSGVVAQSLSNIKFDSQMDKIQLLMEVGRMEDAQKVLTQVREQVNAFGQAASAPAQQRQQQAKPESAKNELESFKAQTFDKELGSSIIAYRDPLIFREAEQWTRGMTLTERQKASLVRDVTSEIGSLLQKDPAWMKEYQAAVAKRDDKSALRLYQDKAAKIAPNIVKDVSRELFGSPVSASRKPATAVSGTPKPVPVVRTPATPGRKVDKFDEIYNS